MSGQDLLALSGKMSIKYLETMPLDKSMEFMYDTGFIEGILVSYDLHKKETYTILKSALPQIITTEGHKLATDLMLFISTDLTSDMIKSRLN